MNHKQNTLHNEGQPEKNTFSQVIMQKKPAPEGIVKRILRKARTGAAIALMSLMVTTACQNNPENPLSNTKEQSLTSNKDGNYATIMCYDKNNNLVGVNVKITPEMEKLHQRYIEGERNLLLHNGSVFYGAADEIIKKYGLNCDREELVSKIVEKMDE
ncbi:MAG: hypothetical protein QXS93_00950 [Candidatus Micrarchaeia archaeon]